MYARDHALIATPIGSIRIDGDETAIVRIQLGAEGVAQRSTASAICTAADQLEAHFSGELKDFTALPPVKSPRGQALREGLIAVGYGDAVSYGEFARRLDSGPRAIGQLCARNPFPIVVPCHRILTAGGALGAYTAGEGPSTKQWLLDHERHHL